jgi:hypothetical protein
MDWPNAIEQDYSIRKCLLVLPDPPALSNMKLTHRLNVTEATNNI